jgi:hypothetical protein
MGSLDTLFKVELDRSGELELTRFVGGWKEDI